MSRTILSWSDVVSSEPALEPVSVVDARRNSDVDDDFRDQDFLRWVTAARKKVEHDARICLVTQTRVRKYDCLPGGRVLDLYKPLASVTSVQYKDANNATQTYSSSNYTVDTARSAVIRTATADWPVVGDSPDVITVTYVAGKAVAAVDERAIQCIHLLVKHWYENPSAYGEARLNEVPQSYGYLIDELKGWSYP